MNDEMMNKDLPDDEDLGNISGRDLQKYLNEIDLAYEERREQRQKRLRRKKRNKRIRRLIFFLLLLVILLLGASLLYIRAEERLSFRLPEQLETVVHLLDPLEKRAEELLAKYGVISLPEETEPAETEPAETEPVETEPAETETSEPESTEPETTEPESTEAETEAPGDTPVAHAVTENSMKQGDKPLDPEVASFFAGYSIDASDAPDLEDPYEEIESTRAVLINLDTGKVVAQRNAEAVVSPASMTKILTILVAAEHLSEAQLDDMVAEDLETSDFVFTTNCSIADMVVGEPITVRDLFYGTILPSGGDAAMTLAKYVAGTTDAFAAMMNEKVEELGLSDTAHFTNCIGLYDEDLHCTMTDMAMILKAAVENDFCREVLSTRKYTTTATETYSEGVLLSNWFLRRIEDYDTNGTMRCAKTGFVNEAGCCAASYMVSDDGTHYICVTGNATSSWQCIYDQIHIYSHYAE